MLSSCDPFESAVLPSSNLRVLVLHPLLRTKDLIWLDMCRRRTGMVVKREFDHGQRAHQALGLMPKEQEDYYYDDDKKNKTEKNKNRKKK